MSRTSTTPRSPCGGTLAALADAGSRRHRGHRLHRAACRHPTGFALACQLDKGLGPDVDYMALRRAEDAAAMAVLGATPVHLDLPEAPHRGYASAPDLFAGVHPGDDVWRDVATRLAVLEADLWLAPQGLGGHVDHLQVGRAAATLGRPVLWWRDSPYVLRDPAARPGPHVPGGTAEVRAPQDRQRRADACACYASQLGFQFGGESGMRTALAGLEEVLLATPAAVGVLQAARAGGTRAAERG